MRLRYPRPRITRPTPARHSDRGNDSPRDDSSTDHSDPPSSTKMSASKSPSASSPVTPETPPFVVSQHKRSASTRSTASSSASSDVSSLPRATKKAEGHVEDGLRERAFACLVRVAARVQAFLGPDDAGECAPLAAFASRVFDDAKCTAGVARRGARPGGSGLGGRPAQLARRRGGSTAAGEGGDRPPPMFPLLAGPYASALRGWGERDAEDARAVSWFVLKLVGRSVALHARREYPPPG